MRYVPQERNLAANSDSGSVAKGARRANDRVRGLIEPRGVIEPMRAIESGDVIASM